MTQFNHTPEQARKLWCEALRSGKYKQNTRWLCHDTPDGKEAFCCLGVACEVFMEYEPGLIDKTPIDSVKRYGNDQSCSTTKLPYTVAKWLGMASLPIMGIPLGLVPDCSRHEEALHVLNDTYRVDFNTIADVIECNYPQGSQT